MIENINNQVYLLIPIEQTYELSRNREYVYHCAECREICEKYHWSESVALIYAHGTDDEKFGVFLSCQ